MPLLVVRAGLIKRNFKNNNMLQLFKKKKAQPLYETDFQAWAEKCSEKELEDYVDKIKEGKEYDYTVQMWGHAFSTSREYGKFIKFGSGFHVRIIGCQQPAVGSILLLKTQGKIGRYLILNIKWVRDPDDMFWAYVVGVGYKE